MLLHYSFWTLPVNFVYIIILFFLLFLNSNFCIVVFLICNTVLTISLHCWVEFSLFLQYWFILFFLLYSLAYINRCGCWFLRCWALWLFSIFLFWIFAFFIFGWALFLLYTFSLSLKISKIYHFNFIKWQILILQKLLILLGEWYIYIIVSPAFSLHLAMQMMKTVRKQSKRAKTPSKTGKIIWAIFISSSGIIFWKINIECKW